MARSRRIEHRVVGHDRHELPGQQLVGLERGGRITQQVEVELVAGQRPLERQEGAAMERRQAEAADRHPVLERRVALVALPAVARDSGRPGSSIIRSRTTLATTDAQAIE